MASQTKVTVKLDQQAVDGLLTDPGVQADLDRRSENALRQQNALVPVKSGNLRRHLGIRKDPTQVGRQIGAFDCDYAAAVEDGHETKSGKWVPGQPYIRPSLDALAQD